MIEISVIFAEAVEQLLSYTHTYIYKVIIVKFAFSKACKKEALYRIT